MIGARANKGQGMLPWLQQTFMVDQDCVITPKNVCVGGYCASGIFRVIAKRHDNAKTRLLKSVLGQGTRTMTEKRA